LSFFDIYLCKITNVTTPYATDAVVVVANLYMITKPTIKHNVVLHINMK